MSDEAYTNTHISTSSSTSEPSTAVSKSKSPTAASASASATQTDSPSTHTGTQTEDQEEKPSSNSAAIGAGVGVGVGAAVLIGALITFLFWRRSKKRQQDETNPYTNNGFPLDQKSMEADDNNTEMYPTSRAISNDQGGATTYAYYAETDPRYVVYALFASRIKANLVRSVNPFVSPQELPVGIAPVELPASPKHQPDFKHRF
ncbi:uncharacterized protein N0V89_001914 [Didymosphaeria variabile]|uniref:Mid2 domain-containing protein n=1 Tax=Didymosphaeria variabile TaxID=1932322 RepID=A0A9W9CE21_9PLEO|nr:uncharacterized protein N0V89_001914 [Didymosphaeria variabile]KAJ4357339.1 hypothetical protein N0V89_001914 [Didymosphaeria variabile]